MAHDGVMIIYKFHDLEVDFFTICCWLALIQSFRLLILQMMKGFKVIIMKHETMISIFYTNSFSHL